MPPISKLSVSQSNKAALLRLLLHEGAMSRIDIASRLGQSKAAVTIITNELLQNGVLEEKGEVPHGATKVRGRRKVLLDLNKNYKLSFGVVIQPGRIAMGLTNIAGETLDKCYVSTDDKSYREQLECIVSEVSRVIEYNCLTQNSILGIGVCTQAELGTGDGAEFLKRLKKDLSHAVSIPIFTETTINGAAVAQLIFAKDRPIPKNLLVIRFGSYTNCAVLIDGRVYHSKTGRAGGFASMKTASDFESYIKALEAEGSKEELTLKMNKELAEIIAVCSSVIDPDMIFVFGHYFEHENRLSEVRFVLRAADKTALLPEAAVVSEPTIYLSACAIAIEKGFFAGLRG